MCKHIVKCHPNTQANKFVQSNSALHPKREDGYINMVISSVRKFILFLAYIFDIIMLFIKLRLSPLESIFNEQMPSANKTKQKRNN